VNLKHLMETYTPGDEWSWEEEFSVLEEIDHNKLRDLESSVVAVGILNPILLGADGRIWDGHHRIYVAHKLGIGEVPVEKV